MSSNALLFVAGVVVLVGFVLASFVKHTQRAHGTRPLIPARYSLLVAGALFLIGVMIKLWSPSSAPTSGVSVSSAPALARPEQEWTTVTIPAHGWSPEYPRPNGMHMVAKGSGFLLVSIYASGERCSYGHPCPENPISITLHNQLAEPNAVEFKFERD